jgi:hypothetical protein
VCSALIIAKKDMVQKFMFQDFLNDPLAVRYFHTYLATQEENQNQGYNLLKVATERTLSGSKAALGAVTEQTDYNENNLLFWEEIRRCVCTNTPS